ncbi:hypothetical protein Tco_0184266 [Tanacetum coccineum]
MPMDDLLQVVPQLISRIDSLETDLKQTKLTMGNAIVKLVKKVKKLEGFLKRRNMVLSDSEEEEPEAQGRKSQDDPLASLVQGLVTPSTTKVNASGEEQVEDISPNTLKAAKTLSMVASLKAKQKDDEQPRVERRKQMARKGLHKDLDKDDSEDSDEVSEQEESVTGTKTPINHVPVAMKSPSIATYKIIKQGEKGVYQIVREYGTDVVYINFGAMLKDISRDDLTELYRIVMNRYGMDGPEDDARRMVYFGKSMDSYMLVERKYPLSAEVCKAMLDKKLQGGKPDENCYKMLKMMEKQAGASALGKDFSNPFRGMGTTSKSQSSHSFIPMELNLSSFSDGSRFRSDPGFMEYTQWVFCKRCGKPIKHHRAYLTKSGKSMDCGPKESGIEDFSCCVVSTVMSTKGFPSYNDAYPSLKNFLFLLGDIPVDHENFPLGSCDVGVGSTKTMRPVLISHDPSSAPKTAPKREEIACNEHKVQMVIPDWGYQDWSLGFRFFVGVLKCSIHSLEKIKLSLFFKANGSGRVFLEILDDFFKTRHLPKKSTVTFYSSSRS